MALDATLDAVIEDGGVVFEFAVENAGEDPVELTFSSGKTADVTVYERGEGTGGSPVWQWSEGRLFTQALRNRTLQPGEVMGEEFRWNDPQPGEYLARGALAANRTAEAETAFTVE